MLEVSFFPLLGKDFRKGGTAESIEHKGLIMLCQFMPMIRNKRAL